MIKPELQEIIDNWKLSAQEEEFTRVLGKDWVQNAHREFVGEIKRMRRGEWGNESLLQRTE